MQIQKVIDEIRELRDALNVALQALEGAGPVVRRASSGSTVTVKPYVHWSQTAKGKLRMAEIATARQEAKRKAEKKKAAS